MSDKETSSSQRKTKAGMLGKNSDSESSAERESKSNAEQESAPKISRDNAFERDHDKPLH